MLVLRNKKSDIILIFAIVVLLSVVGMYQKHNHGNGAAKTSEPLNYLPSGEFLKGLALGYDEAFADFLWVRTVGYFGLHSKTDQDFTWLKHMLKLTTILDPRYESPYEFAAVILPTVLDDVDGAVAFLKKGIENIPKQNPRYWLQPFYLGFCYMVYLDEPVKAAEYFSMAARYPQSPTYLPFLISRLYASQRQPDAGMSILQDFLDHPKRGVMQNEHLKRALMKRMKELIVARHLKYLESAVAEYERFYHEPPARLSDLVDRWIIPFVPEEPRGGYYFYSVLTNSVQSSEKEPEFERSKFKKDIKIII